MQYLCTLCPASYLMSLFDEITWSMSKASFGSCNTQQW
jgi:hypothetical protein